MDTTVHIHRARRGRYGWSAEARPFVALNGERLWVVSGQRGKQAFSVRASTQQEAWRSAWDLAQQLQGHRVAAPAILPFPGRRAEMAAG